MNTEQFSTILDTLDKYQGSEHIALICGEEKLTYKELIADARHITRGLSAEGVKKGERVLFSMHNTADAIRALLGILYAGASYVAADPDWPGERLSFVRRDAQTVFDMTDESCLRLREKDSAFTELPKITGEDEAAIYYTSGSTGQPKGAILHHVVFSTLLDSIFCSDPENYPGLEEWQIYQCMSKLPYIASLLDLGRCLLTGKTLFLPTEQEQGSLAYLAAAMKRHRPDVMAGTPSVILHFMEQPAFAGVFADLKHVSLCGERLIPSMVQRISRGTKGSLSTPYGSSEMMHCAEYYCQNNGEIHLGKGGHGVSLHILDESLAEVLPGKEGELFIGGIPARFGHYLNRPDLNAEKYLEHPRFGRLFCTGDLARLETDGEITLLGRKDGMVKLHGQRIEIGEVENALSSFPGVRRAAVTLQEVAGRKALCGFYTAEMELEDRELRQHLAKKLPVYMIPAFLRRLPQMPENEHGKLAYRALPPIEKEKPLVSVLTPVHAIPLELLGRAACSLAAQDYDRERVQWLIAVHNMDEAYLEQVQKTVGNSPRIRVFPVKEPKGLLSAVRNALLDGAQGRYIFGLDGDDELLPGCISRAVEFMEQSRSDMLLFPCEEIREKGGDTFPRVLNYGGRDPAAYEQGDPRIGELMAGCALDVWSWCFRSSFLRETGVRFDEGDACHFCGPLFVIRAIALARRVAVLPGAKGYAYHIRSGSDSQERTQVQEKEKTLPSCREMICVMRKAAELEDFSLHRFLWSCLANTCFFLQIPALGREERRRIREAMLPYVRKLRVLAPCPAVSADRARQLADFVEQLFPEAAEEFRQPRYGHRQEAVAILPSAEEITARIRALDYIGCKTLPEGECVYLGKAEDAAAPEVVTVDLRRQGEPGKEDTERQLSLMEGYRRMEELRGFGPQEVPCRVTLFHLGETSGRILVTWDERFLHHSFAEWLFREIS